jgi:hypothetical protein
VPQEDGQVSAIDLSSYLGLAAMTLLTLNLLQGILLSVKYNPAREWPRRRIDTVQLHNWTAYVALALAITHPLILLASGRVHFRVVDLLFPPGGPKQPLVNSYGALALYALIFIVVTSYFRFEIGRRIWKRLHYAAYGMAALFYIHGIFTDPQLRDGPFRLDPFDGEKVYVELCLLLVIAAGALRLRHQRRLGPARVHRPKTRRQASAMREATR